MKIQLNTVEDVKTFVTKAIKCPKEVTLSSGRHVIDAKSLLGVFSLDLSKPVSLTIAGDADDDFLSGIRSYIVSA